MRRFFPHWRSLLVDGGGFCFSNYHSSSGFAVSRKTNKCRTGAPHTCCSRCCRSAWQIHYDAELAAHAGWTTATWPWWHTDYPMLGFQRSAMLETDGSQGPSLLCKEMHSGPVTVVDSFPWAMLSSKNCLDAMDGISMNDCDWSINTNEKNIYFNIDNKYKNMYSYLWASLWYHSLTSCIIVYLLYCDSGVRGGEPSSSGGVTGTIFIISVSGEVDPESVLWSSTIHLVWTPPHWLHIACCLLASHAPAPPPTERLRRKIKNTWKNKNASNTKNSNICRLFGEGSIEKTRKTLEK